MPKYTDIKGADLIKLLSRHGFVIHTKAGSHYTLKNFATGKRTVVPVHNKPIGIGLLKAILNQCGLGVEILKML